ncbi:MAG TPA: VCBS repeat-containing protein, partial [Candidatus Polarisedimenticolia bacterium]|nr:VCBS repeat-containing protein [Candidatus Polarisedimenticolia bacterium]
MRPGLPDRPGALASADFNLDGKADLIEANFEAGDISFFQEDLTGNYVERNPSPFLVQDGPTFLAVADLTKDNRPDLVIVDRIARRVSIAVSDVDLTFKAVADLIVGRAPQAVALADFNRDTRLDLAVTSEFDDGVYLFYGKGDGTFSFARVVDAKTPAQKSDGTQVGVYGIASGDFDRDGKLDLAVTQFCTDQLAILRGNGNGTFQAATTLAVGRHPTYLSPVRLGDDQLPGNLDDFQDLIVLLTGGSQSDPKDCKKLSGASLPGGIVPVLGNGDGTFTLGVLQTESAADAPTQFAVGRLLGSNFDDVVVANFGTNTLSLYPADGANGFLSPILLGGAGSTLRNPNAIALVDRDVDGLPDRIAVSNWSGNSVTLFDGGGGNPFIESPFSPVTATRGPVAFAAATLDTSASTDLAVLSAGNDSLQTFNSLNNGFFFKRRQTPLPSGSGPTAIALADFDKDLNLDAAFAVSDMDGTSGPSVSPAFTIMTGSGIGTFGAVVGTCSGGSNAGESCTSDADCPSGGLCSFSLSLGTCQDGTRDGKSCTSDGDCPSGSCLLPPAPTPLQGVANALLAVDLNAPDADRDGVADASDNCPSRYNPLQINTRGITCQSGANNGLPCTLDTQCPGGTCTHLDARGDDCDSSSADPDADDVVDLNDNCLDLYNPTQVDTDADLVGDACDSIPDVVALESSPSQIEVFMRSP